MKKGIFGLINSRRIKKNKRRVKMPCLQCKKCGNWTYVKPGEKKKCLSCGGELIQSSKCPFSQIRS